MADGSLMEHVLDRASLHQAWERVRENHGCRGSDGVTVADFGADLEHQLDLLQASLFRRRYHPLPLLRFSVPKKAGGMRFLAVPSVRDRVVQTAAYLATRERFDAELEEVSFAFREGRSVQDAVRRVQQLRDEGYRWVVDADVDSFFDTIPHDGLFERLGRLGLDPRLERLFHLWVEAEVYDGESLWRMDKGIPQGAVVSPSLANLFLDQLDESLAVFGQKLVRYADDFLVVCRSPREAGEALEITDYLLGDLGLRLDPDKTQVTSFDHGFRFLGAIFVGNSVFLTLPKEREPGPPLELPPPLDLLTYLELRPSPWPSST